MVRLRNTGSKCIDWLFYSTFINGFNSGEQECKEAQDQEEEKEDRERQQQQEEWTEIGPRSTMLNHFSSS